LAQTFKTIIFAMITLFLTLSLIIFPEESLHASIRGLSAWGEVVFPSLLPFFITAELLISFGVVQFIGVLFEPVMRPLFKVPGVGSFAWMVGMASGYPSGAKISASLREKKAISRIEAERLVSFSNASSPLFIFGAMAVGFLNNAKLGILLAATHYGTNAIVGMLMRFYGKNEELEKIDGKKPKQALIVKAFKKMHRTRMQDERPLGQILGDAVVSSIQTLIMVGGFIILFSVFTTLLHVIQLTDVIQFMLKPIFFLFAIPDDIVVPFITGIFEITMGVERISNLSDIPLVIQIALISFMLGFNGLSIQAQVASILAKTDIRFLPYFFARIMHASIASIVSILLYKTYFEDRSITQDAAALDRSNHSYQIIEYLSESGALITIASIFAAICIVLNRLMRTTHHKI